MGRLKLSHLKTVHPMMAINQGGGWNIMFGVGWEWGGRWKGVM